jgi:hypothetical protein
MSGYSRAMNPAAVIAAAGLTWTILKDTLTPTTDIVWNREYLVGKKHPRDDASFDGKGTWASKTVTVSAGMETAVGDRQSADFEITFFYNCYSLGPVNIENTGTNDAWLWKLTIDQRIIPIPDHMVGGKGPAATVQVIFNYRHYSSIHEDQIYIETVTLYGTGDVGRSGRWTQSGGY